MVVVGVLVADADDAESLRIQRARPFVLPSIEFCFDFDIDVLPREVIDHIVDLRAFQGNGAVVLRETI